MKNKKNYSKRTNDNEKHCEMPPRHRNNIVMIKLAMPKKVTLPNGRTFYAKYKRVKGDSLPDNVTIKYTYKRRTGRRRQRGKRLNTFLEKWLQIVKKKKSLKVYKKSVSKVKNKRLKNILNSSLANSALDIRKSYAYGKLS